MLKKLKRPELYINYGVWVFLPENNELVKRKIQYVNVTYNLNYEFSVKNVFVQGIGNFSPEDVYMSRKEAFREGIKKFQNLLNNINKEKECHEINLKFQIEQCENKIECQKRELKNVLKHQDKFLTKKNVSEQDRNQIRFFQELGFEKMNKGELNET